MGSDKRVVTIDGEPLLARAVRRVVAAGLPVSVVGGPDDVPTPAGHLADAYPGQGPMGGVLTALGVLPTPLGVVGVDMPDVSLPLLDALAARRPLVAAVPVADGRLQVLHAAWGPDALAVLREAWQAGERSLRRLLAEREDIDQLDEETCTKLTGDVVWWTSLDTPTDLARRQAR